MVEEQPDQYSECESGEYEPEADWNDDDGEVADESAAEEAFFPKMDPAAMAEAAKLRSKVEKTKPTEWRNLRD